MNKELHKKRLRLFLILDILLALLLIMEYAERFGMGEMKEINVWTEVDQAVDTRQEQSKKIALTFDDGPNPTYTPMLLDGLAERGVHATFFLMGQNAERYPELVTRLYEEGHLIGNHTYTHMQLTDTEMDAFVAELSKTDELIFGITGVHTEFVRPPFGIWNKKIETKLGMLPVLWTIDPRDWCTSNTDTVTNRIVSHAEENGIILLHDGYQSSVEAALRVIDILQAEGYEFVTVDEIIMD